MTKAKPKTIKIFLSDGEPTGTKIVELSNWTGIAYLIPRNRLKSTLSNPDNKNDLDSQCVYFLIGESEEEKRTVYIGEAEEFSKRINQHHQGKDFWNLVMVFTSKDDNLTKAHVKYLESKVTQEVRANNTVQLENGNIPPMPKLPRSDIAEMEEFYEQMKIVASSLGYTFLEHIEIGAKSENLLFCKGNDCEAKGIMNDEGFFLLEGSLIKKAETPSFGEIDAKRRKSARIKGDIEDHNENQYRVVKKIKFTSPSASGAFVLGRRVNGWQVWKNSEGKTLDELKRK